MRIKYLFIFSILIILNACGLGGQEFQLPKDLSKGNIQGSVLGGLYIGGTINIYSLNDDKKRQLLATTKIQENGDFALNFPSPTQPLLIEARGGRYLDPSNLEILKTEPDFIMNSVFMFKLGETHNIQITPFTHLAAGLILYLKATNPEKIDDSTIQSSHTKINELYSINNSNQVKISPIENTSQLKIEGDEKHGLLITALAQIAYKERLKKENTLKKLYNLASLNNLIYEDIRSDGILDGKSIYEYGGNVKILAFGNQIIDSNFYRLTIAFAIEKSLIDALFLDFNDKNTQEKYILSIAQKESSLLTELNHEALHKTTPQIQLVSNVPDIEKAELPLKFKVEQSFTLNNIKLIIDEQETNFEPNSIYNPDTNLYSIIIDTMAYDDGPHQISINVNDTFNNIANLEASVTFDNKPPTLTISSENLTNNGKHLLQGTFNDELSDVKKITINGRNVDFFTNNRWEKPVTLVNGENKFLISIEDEVGNSAEFSTEVFFIESTPVITITSVSSTSSPQFVLQGQYIDEQSLITRITVNGDSAIINIFEKKWSMQVSLENGQNEFTIGAGNDLVNFTELTTIVTLAIPDTQNPSVPSDLLATAVSAEKINLNWKESTDLGGTVSGYRIFRDDGENMTEIATATNTSYSDTGLTASTLYSYTVSAFDNAEPANESAPSNAVNVTTLATPTIIRVNSGGNQYVDELGNIWAADFGFNTGHIGTPFKTIANTTNQPLFDNNRYDLDTITELTHGMDVTPELRYSFSVPNADYTVRLYFAETFNAPYGVGVRVFDINMEGIKVWKNLDIFKEVGAETLLIKEKIIAVNDEQLDIEFLHGLAAHPIVSAIEILQLPSGPDIRAPTVPSDFTINAVSDTQINLSWTASIDLGGGTVAGYNIYRNGGDTPIATVTDTGYSDTGLTAETIYSYTVSAFDNALPINESIPTNATNAATLTPHDTQAPTTPTDFTVTAVSDTQIDLSWTASSDFGGGTVAGYNIYRKGNDTPIATVTDTSYSNTGLTANTSYSYTLLAFDDAIPLNKSIPTNEMNVTTLVSPTHIRVNSGGNQYIDEAGDIWSADFGFNTGHAGLPFKTIAGTADQPLFFNNRYDLDTSTELALGLIVTPKLQYSFTVPNGQYLIKLYFAETHAPAYTAGARVFNVKIEDILIWKNLDIFAEAGAETMLIKENAVTVSDGQINIEFLHGLADHPMVSAIEIIGTSVADAAPTIDPLSGTYFGPVDVTLNTLMPRGQIYYTLDGSVPTQASTPYTAPFAISSNAQLRTRAFNGVNSSGTSIAHFTVFTGPLSYDFTSGNAGDWVTIDDSTGASNWIVTGGEFVQSNERGIVYFGAPTDAPSSFDGTYHLGTYAYLSTGMGLTNYRVSLDMTPIPDSSWYVVENGHDIGVMFRYVDINNYYRLSLNSAYGFARLEKKVDGVFTTLVVDGRGYQGENQVINITIEVMDDLIHVYVNGEARFAFQDADLSTGSIALYTQDGAKFDNIVVNNNNIAPAIIIDDPLAYTVGLVDQFTVSAVVMNMPVGGSVEFDIDGSLCTPVTEDSPRYFFATCPVVSAGEHTVTAILKDSGSVQVASDTNAFVGSSGDNYVTIGDSISNGIGDKYQSDNGSTDGKIISSQAYASILHNLLNTSKSTPQFVFNEGISGETTSGTLNTRINSILERQYNINHALVMLGTNDSGGTTPIFPGISCGTACDGTYHGNMQALINVMNSSGITTFIAIPPPVFDSADPLNSTRNSIIQNYITVIQTELNGHHTGPDFFTYFLSVDEDRRSLFIDNVHPNALGHKLMAYLWDHYLNGNSSLPSRNQLPLVLEDICVRLTSASCETPLVYKQNLLEADGDPYYVDETFSLTNIPAILQDGLWLSTANADQANTRNDYLSFTVDRNVDVYVAYDPGATTLPDWMAGFTDTTQDLGVTDTGSSTLRLYHKAYIVGVNTPVDGTILLGGNMAAGAVGASRNYVVIIK